MQTKTAIIASYTFSFTGLAAIIAGALYSARWIWELHKGILKNMQYPPSLINQNFFMVKALMICTLISIYRATKGNKSARRGLLVACIGLTWTGITRTLDAYGAPGPWGFYSSPGLMLFFVGLFTAGIALKKAEECSACGKALTTISILYFLGGFSSMLLFNILGRTLAANHTASVVANMFMIAEGLSWCSLGVLLLSKKLIVIKGLLQNE